jgi:hypothetical protein
MFLSHVVVIGAYEVVGDATFILLKVTTQSTFYAEGDDKMARQRVTYFFIKV